MPDIIRWGMIGCGKVTEVKSGPCFNMCRGSALAAVMRRNGALAEDYARRHRVPRWYDDAARLIDDDGVDAVYVATPPSSHAEYAIAAMRAGKPVYVEKPMSATYEGAERMLAESKRLSIPLYVAYYRRALDYFNFVRDYVMSGEGGRPVAVRVWFCSPPESAPTWHTVPEISGGGLFHDLACHTLDALDYILGPVSEARGRSLKSGSGPADDLISAEFGFECGAVGTGLFYYDSFRREDDIVIELERASVKFSTFSFYPIEIHEKGGVSLHEIPRPKHVQAQLIQNVVDSLHGLAQPLSTGESALRAQRVMALLTGELA